MVHVALACLLLATVARGGECDDAAARGVCLPPTQLFVSDPSYLQRHYFSRPKNYDKRNTKQTNKNATDDDNYVTCGSAIKMESADTGYYLNSEEKQLGSGSRQQIVTFVKDASTRSTLWWVRPGHDESNNDEQEYPSGATCQLAAPVACGTRIRLTHVDTMRNLHSHEYKSPLSNQQEVTAYGQGDAKGDAGDDWIVECDGKYWKRDAVFRLVRSFLLILLLDEMTTYP